MLISPLTVPQSWQWCANEVPCFLELRFYWWLDWSSNKTRGFSGPKISLALVATYVGFFFFFLLCCNYIRVNSISGNLRLFHRRLTVLSTCFVQLLTLLGFRARISISPRKTPKD